MTVAAGLMERLAAGSVLGDGGYLLELERRGYVRAGPFTPEVSITNPEALAQLHRVADGLRPRFAAAAELLESAAEDVLAHFHFPSEHRRRLHSTNPLERLHKEVKRRTQVVGIFPDRASLIRLAGMLLAEQDDEWAVTDRRYFTFESMARINEPEGGEPKELLAAIA